MPRITCFIEPPKENELFVRRSCILERNSIGGACKQDQLYFNIPKSIPPIEEDDGEPFLIAALMAAMMENRHLKLIGTVSPLLLANLYQYSFTWNCWLPNQYKRIDIEATQMAATGGEKNGSWNSAVAGFSGGVDASFLAYSHKKGLWGNHSRKIELCTMVKGFDIPLGRDGEFSDAFRSCESTLKSLDIPLIPIETNFRQVIQSDWINIFGSALAATLQFLKPLGYVGLMASSAPYNHLALPCGSNPITDPLLSSESFRIIHDGASFSRTEKVKAISGWKEARKNLRVCWQGENNRRNCGVCEKCIRTKLNFQVNGLPVPTGLGGPVGKHEIKRLVINHDAIYAEFVQLHQAALQNKIVQDWVFPLGNFLRSHIAKQQMRRTRKFIKKRINQYLHLPTKNSNAH